MSVFDPECSGNRFSAEFRLTGDGLSMGDMVHINREFARVIREAKHARVV